MDNIIKELRYRFIMLCTGCVAVVLFSVVGAINIANIIQQRLEIKSMLEYIADHDGKFGAGAKDDDLGITPESAYTTRFFIGLVNQDNMIFKTNADNIAALTEEDIVSYVGKALSSQQEMGRIDNYFYSVNDTPYGKKIVFLDSVQYLRNLRKLLLISLGVALGVLITVMFVVAVVSDRIMRPYIDNMEKQHSFVTNAGHELKTPLTIIMANAELLALENESDSKENGEYIESIINQTKRLTKLVTSLVTLSKMNEEREKFDINAFNLSEACHEVYDAFKVLAERKNRILTENVQEDIKYVGDEKAIRELLSILLDNAIKYSNDGGDISIALYRQKSNIILETSNTTDGIDVASLPKLFDRFYRPDTSRSRETGGFGIGLSIASAIVTAHKGKIKASSDDGLTIRFTVTLQ